VGSCSVPLASLIFSPFEVHETVLTESIAWISKKMASTQPRHICVYKIGQPAKTGRGGGLQHFYYFIKLTTLAEL
jgi:hypothetical protein